MPQRYKKGVPNWGTPKKKLNGIYFIVGFYRSLISAVPIRKGSFICKTREVGGVRVVGEHFILGLPVLTP